MDKNNCFANLSEIKINQREENMFEGIRLDTVMSSCVDVDAILAFQLINGEDVGTLQEQLATMSDFFDELAASIDNHAAKLAEAASDEKAAAKKAEEDAIEKRVQLLEEEKAKIEQNVRLLKAPTKKAKTTC